MFLDEAIRFSWQALRASPVRSLLTGLGMVIGTASVILVVTISLTSRDYILEQVQGIGSNIIFAYYASAGGSTVSDADYIKMPDVQAIRQELTSDIVAATGVMSNFDRILIGGKEQDVKVIGTDQDYQPVRNIVISSGRFLDEGDLTLRTKAALLTDQLATRMFGGRAAALSQVIKIYGLRVHRDRHVPRESGDVRAIGSRAGYDTDPDHRAALLYPGGADRSAVRAGAFAAGSGPGGDAAAGDPGGAAPARRAVPGGHPDRHSQCGQEHLADSLAGAGAGFRDHAADLRHRDHEHHAGDGDRADAGNRRSAGGGGVAARRFCCSS